MKRTNIVIILAVCLLLLPQAVRFLSGNADPAGLETYALLAGEGRSGVLLSPLVHSFSPLLLQGIAILLGVASIILLRGLLVEHVQDRKKEFFILLIIAISPFFIALFTQLSTVSIALFFSLLILRFRIVPALLLIPLIDAYVGLGLGVLFLIFSFTKDRQYLEPALLFGGVVVTYFLLGKDAFALAPVSSFMGSFLSELGSKMGYSVSAIILAGIGYAALWKKTHRTILSALLLLVCFLVTYMFPVFIPLFGFVVSIYAGIGVWSLTRKKWTLTLVRDATLLLILCTLFFSTAAFSGRLIAEHPRPSLVRAMHYLAALPDGNVLALQEYGVYVRYFSGKTVVDSGDVFASRNVQQTLTLCEEKGITYVLVDQKTRDELIARQQLGLFFLFEYGEIFTEIYDEEGISLWVVSARPQ